MAIKFHPDKNYSEKAPDAFKKISHCYQVLTNEEKRDFYDKYGDEDDVRKQMHQQQQRHQRHFQFEGDQDPFEVFRMFFGGMDGGFEFQDGRIFRNQNVRRRQREPERREPPNRFSVIISQLLPLILIFIMYVLPYLMQSVSHFLYINLLYLDSFMGF